ncbi:unnamed protein product [Porites lobata]|uniref:Uncharacterized protein n=1 Tax=Porites lobata TaxID=104759 RepID=A0ABN8RPN9_9CNID|nr:unnamed protein product [Porites lobata]
MKSVSLESALTWIIRELRLHGVQKEIIELSLKLDDRPFAGRSQVLMGVVPKDKPFLSNQSCKSVCPLAIANCKEDRYENLKKLIVNINKQKDALKKNGITVDGVHYAVRFKVILDLKALYLLLEQIGKRTFSLENEELKYSVASSAKH